MTNRANRDSTQLAGELRHTLHELNNALTPILANAQLARVMLDPSATDIREALDDVVEAAGRANALVAEMRELVLAIQDSGSDTDKDATDGREASDG